MTYRDSPLGSDVRWRPSLLSDALCCSQLVQLGLEKGFITFQDKISCIVFERILPFQLFSMGS